jgi:hypothetical protein
VIRLSTIGYRGGAFLPGQTALPGFVDGLDRDDLVTATAMVEDATVDGGTLVVVVPRWADEPAVQRLETIRCALDTKRLVVHRSDLPPLAGAVFVALADGLRGQVDTPGRLIGALPALAQQVVVLARLSRLSGLTEPPPTVWQHLVSLLPATTFGVSSFPEPAVQRLTKHEPLMPLPQVKGAAGMALALAAHGGGTLDWAHEELVPALGSPRVVEAIASPVAERWWGSAPGLEAVLYPTDLAATAQFVARHVLLRRCGSCGLDSPFDVCPYCGVHEPRPLAEDEDPTDVEMAGHP